MSEYDESAWGTPWVVESVAGALGVDIPEHPEPMPDWTDSPDPNGEFGFYYEFEDAYGQLSRGVIPYEHEFQATDHYEIAEELIGEDSGASAHDDWEMFIVKRRDLDHPPREGEIGDEIWEIWRPLEARHA
jgi:hypothetical protein